MSKKIGSTQDSIQQASTAYPSVRSGDRGSLDATSFGSSRKFFNGSGSNMGGGSYKSYMNDHLTVMQNDIESTTRRLELEQRRLYKLDKELGIAESEYDQKRQRFTVHSQQQADAVDHNAQEKRLLERRLEKAIADLNKGTCENEQLREQIDQLRKERIIFDTMFKQLEKGIKDKGKTIEKVKMTMKEDKLCCEEAKQKNRALTKILERERRAFQKECERLKKEVHKENEVQKEQTKLTRDASAKDGQGKKGSKRTYMVADEEEAFSEQLMHRRILKLSFLNTIQRRHIKQHQKNIEVFEQAFSTIKMSTGIHEIEEIVKIFVGLEQRNFSLLTYVNQLNREIESIEIRNRELNNQLKDYENDQTDSAARKNHNLQGVNSQIQKTKQATAEKSSMIEEQHQALIDCRPVIWKIVKLLKKEMPPLVHLGYEGDVPPMKTPPPDEHEESLNTFLMYVEEALMQFRVCLAHEPRRIPEIPHQKGAGDKSGQTGMKKPSGAELPSAHIAGDDSDDDPEAGLSDRPLNRVDLRKAAAAMIARRRKKGGGAGKVHSEQKAAADAADDNEPVKDSSSRSAAMAPPPPRDFTASTASKESKDDSGLSAVSLSKSPSMSGKQLSEGAAVQGGEDTYRDEMQGWRNKQKK